MTPDTCYARSPAFGRRPGTFCRRESAGCLLIVALMDHLMPLRTCASGACRFASVHPLNVTFPTQFGDDGVLVNTA